jgi:hypothetical protein
MECVFVIGNRKRLDTQIHFDEIDEGLTAH